MVLAASVAATTATGTSRVHHFGGRETTPLSISLLPASPQPCPVKCGTPTPKVVGQPALVVRRAQTIAYTVTLDVADRDSQDMTVSLDASVNSALAQHYCHTTGRVDAGRSAMLRCSATVRVVPHEPNRLVITAGAQGTRTIGVDAVATAVYGQWMTVPSQ